MPLPLAMPSQLLDMAKNAAEGARSITGLTVA
jgi:hypothetical protein